MAEWQGEFIRWNEIKEIKQNINYFSIFFVHFWSIKNNSNIIFFLIILFFFRERKKSVNYI